VRHIEEETRRYLKGVFLDSPRVHRATNGHIAFAARCNDAFAGPIAARRTIPPDNPMRA
jgi:hypothetical protein